MLLKHFGRGNNIWPEWKICMYHIECCIFMIQWILIVRIIDGYASMDVLLHKNTTDLTIQFYATKTRIALMFTKGASDL